MYYVVTTELAAKAFGASAPGDTLAGNNWNPVQLPSNQQNGLGSQPEWGDHWHKIWKHWQCGVRRCNAAIFIQLEFKQSSSFIPESANPFSRPPWAEGVAAEHRGIKQSAQCICSDCIHRYVTRRPDYSPEEAPVRQPVGPGLLGPSCCNL
jgi:hypothetical protein